MLRALAGLLARVASQTESERLCHCVRIATAACTLPLQPESGESHG